MSATWDQSKFDMALKEYGKVTKRTTAEVINTKLYYVARGAQQHTAKASASGIKATLARPVTIRRQNKSGRFRRTKAVEYGALGSSGKPLAALIVNARRKAKGQKGLFGEELTRAVITMINSRVRSVAFLRAGWIESIKQLAAFAKDKSGAPAGDPSARQFGAPLGSAIAASDGALVQFARIENRAISKKSPTSEAALNRFGEVGLQVAFDREAQSMLEYLDRKMGPATAEANAKMR